MDIASVLEKYDLDLSTVLTNDGLVSLRNAYSELLDTLSADTETQQNREKQIRDELARKTVDLTDVRELVARFVEREGDDYLVSLAEELLKIRQEVMVMRDFHVSSVARDNKPEKVKDAEDVEVRKQEASTLREAIVSVFSLMGRPTTVEGFPVKENKDGVITPDLPRVPIGNSTGAVRGRGAKVRQMLFEVNGKAIPAGTLFYNVVRDLCDLSTGFVIKPGEIKDMVESDGGNFAPEGYDNRWTVDVNGNSLSGWLPTEK